MSKDHNKNSSIKLIYTVSRIFMNPSANAYNIFCILFNVISGIVFSENIHKNNEFFNKNNLFPEIKIVSEGILIIANYINTLIHFRWRRGPRKNFKYGR